MSISLCMIVKDEEAMLPRCLESVKHLADEMVVVDTGSSDRTADIARSFGAKVLQYPWDGSFANARNFALSHAQMDWILLMDADDEFELEDTEKLLHLVLTERQSDVFYFRTVSFMGSVPNKTNAVYNMNVRLVRNGSGYLFKGDIHEQLVKGDSEESSVGFADIRIYHYGYLNSVVASKKKRERNIALIEKQLEQDPDDPFMLNNMGNEYYSLCRFGEALEWYLKSYAHFDSRRGYSSKLLIRIISCYDLLGNTEEQHRFIEEGLKIYPNFTDLEFIRANDFLRRKKYLAAIRSFKRCLEMGDPPLIFSYAVGIGSYKTQYLLAALYDELGDRTSALRFCKKAIESNPEYQEAYLLLCHIWLVSKTSVKTIRKNLERLARPGRDAAKWLLLSDVFYSLQLYEAALGYAAKARLLSPDNELADYDEGVCRFFMKQYRGAYGLLEKVRQGDSADKALFFRLLCAHLDGGPRPETPRGNEYVRVFEAFERIADGGKAATLAGDAEASQPYIAPIFNLLDILLKLGEFDLFDKSRQLLNLISDDSVLLRLGKLYFYHGFQELAYKELVRSLTLTGQADAEGLEMMKYHIGQKRI